MRHALPASVVAALVGALLWGPSAMGAPVGATEAVAGPTPAVLAAPDPPNTALKVAADEPKPGATTGDGGTYATGFLHGLGYGPNAFGMVTAGTFGVAVIGAAVRGFPTESAEVLGAMALISAVQLVPGMLLVHGFEPDGAPSRAWRAGRGFGAGTSFLAYAGLFASTMLLVDRDPAEADGMATLAGVIVTAVAAGGATTFIVDGSLELGELLDEQAREASATAFRPTAPRTPVVPLVSGAW